MKDVEALLEKVIEENPALVGAWAENQKGAWGALAGKALVAVSKGLDKQLNDAEKRLVWQLLWNKLVAIKDSQ